jgi:hypothetical protein
MPFRFGTADGGAKVLDGVLVPFAADVVLVSDGFSEEVGSTAAGRTDGLDEEADFERACDGFRDGSTLVGNLARTSGESLRTTVLDFAGLADILVVRAVVVVVVVDEDMGVGDGKDEGEMETTECCGDERLFVSVGGSPEGQSRGWFVRGASKSGVGCRRAQWRAAVQCGEAARAAGMRMQTVQTRFGEWVVMRERRTTSVGGAEGVGVVGVHDGLVKSVPYK